MNLKINKNHLYANIGYAIIAIASLSTVLRPSIDSKITLFRIILPFIFIFLFFKIPKKMTFFSIISFLLLLYSAFLSSVTEYDGINYNFYLYTIVIILFYFIVEYIVTEFGIKNFYSFLKRFFFLIIILGFIQIIFGGSYPNTQYRLPEINIFFWNGNEYAANVAAFFPLYFIYEKGIKRYVVLILVFVIMIHTGSRLTMISTTLFIISYFFIKFNYSGFKFPIIIALIASSLFSIIYFWDYPIFDMTVGTMFGKPFVHIFTLDPLLHIGSVNLRTNAIIYGIQDLIDSNFLGTGPGNSIPMMESHIIPGTEKYTAYSMHNFILQVIVEWGVVGLALLSLIFYITIKAIRRNNFLDKYLLIVYYIAMNLNLTMLSGPWSNYLFLTIFFFSIFLFKSSWQGNIHKKNEINKREF